MRQLAFRVSDALSETGAAAGLQTRLSFRAQARVLIRLFRVFRGKLFRMTARQDENATVQLANFAILHEIHRQVILMHASL